MPPSSTKEPDTTVTSAECDALFAQYVDVCNKALAVHWRQFPYKQIWNAARRAFGEKAVGVAVYDDEPKRRFDLQLKQQHIVCTEDAVQDDARVWRVQLSYLRHVVEHPDEYIENPARLDWDWLKGAHREAADRHANI